MAIAAVGAAMTRRDVLSSATDVIPSRKTARFATVPVSRRLTRAAARPSEYWTGNRICSTTYAAPMISIAIPLAAIDSERPDAPLLTTRRDLPHQGQRCRGVPMPSHKFKIGDVVTIKPAISRNVPGGIYQVTKRLPENQGEFEYCIKNLEEPYARVARESELTKA